MWVTFYRYFNFSFTNNNLILYLKYKFVDIVAGTMKYVR